MRPITLKQIAEQLNISVSTVSKALKDYPDIGEETKAQVKELAKKLNYKPNALAINLRTSSRELYRKQRKMGIWSSCYNLMSPSNWKKSKLICC